MDRADEEDQASGRARPPSGRMIRVSCFEEVMLGEKQSGKDERNGLSNGRKGECKGLEAGTNLKGSVTSEMGKWQAALLDRSAAVRTCRCLEIIVKPYFKHLHSSYVLSNHHDGFESIVIPVSQEVKSPAQDHSGREGQSNLSHGCPGRPSPGPEWPSLDRPTSSKPVG